MKSDTKTKLLSAAVLLGFRYLKKRMAQKPAPQPPQMVEEKIRVRFTDGHEEDIICKPVQRNN